MFEGLHPTSGDEKGQKKRKSPVKVFPQWIKVGLGLVLTLAVLRSVLVGRVQCLRRTISIQLFDSAAFTVCLNVPHQWTLYPSGSFSIDPVPLVRQLLVPLLSSFRISFLSVFACHKHSLVSATIELDSIEMEGQHSVSSLEEPKGDESVVAETSCSIPRTGPNNFLSKHRMVAAITLLQNQINFLQEELDQLDTLGESSIVCEE
ncbi:hypothetical protein SADUNF_Sadunf05G0129600 [Salix dunnii]|uniref:Uncharacterized protein n=1 Tax=Salix dunnii TaxID=1413687 RepID=A0A835K1T6_9ROSI|nr:hypothetical protein SADUNF_Sadunf05G0129600 [Salix dunnii]